MGTVPNFKRLFFVHFWCVANPHISLNSFSNFNGILNLSPASKENKLHIRT